MGPSRLLPDIVAAKAFIHAEPYTAHGVFDRVEIRTWARVLPEVSTART